MGDDHIRGEIQATVGGNRAGGSLNTREQDGIANARERADRSVGDHDLLGAIHRDKADTLGGEPAARRDLIEKDGRRKDTAHDGSRPNDRNGEGHEELLLRTAENRCANEGGAVRGGLEVVAIGHPDGFGSCTALKTGHDEP